MVGLGFFSTGEQHYYKALFFNFYPRFLLPPPPSTLIRSPVEKNFTALSRKIFNLVAVGLLGFG